MSRRIFIVAGEASGDLLGGALMQSLHQLSTIPLEFKGIGGEHMEAAGLNSLFPMEKLSLMGFAEILPHAWNLACLLKQTCDSAVEFRPDVVITIDSPGFNFRLAAWLRRCFGKKIILIHYVAPTVWAYKPQRAKTCAALFDHLITLLPFEAPYFQAYGMRVTYAGHPVADGFVPNLAAVNTYKVGNVLHVILFPGSRLGELKRLLPLYHNVMILLHKRYRTLKISLVTTAALRSYVELRVKSWRYAPMIIERKEARENALKNAHIALTKTGTVTLEIARNRVPMVATYRVHPITAWALSKMLTIPFVNLINIMAGRSVIPELIQEDCNAVALYNALCHLIDNPLAVEKQVMLAQESLFCMQNPDSVPASIVAANAILSYIEY